MKKKSQIETVAYYFTKSASEIINKDVDKAIRYVNNEMYDEAVKMYDTFIDQFYSYKTTSYVRHWEGVPGTQEGQNLYFGKDIRKFTKHPKLVINLPSDAGYVSNGGGQAEPMANDYRFNTSTEVMEYVFSGVRFPDFITYKKRGGNSLMTWEGRYKGTYFYYNGTMENAFNKFNEDFDKIAMRAVRKYLKTLGYF